MHVRRNGTPLSKGTRQLAARPGNLCSSIPIVIFRTVGVAANELHPPLDLELLSRVTVMLWPGTEFFSRLDFRLRRVVVLGSARPKLPARGSPGRTAPAARGDAGIHYRSIPSLVGRSDIKEKSGELWSGRKLVRRTLWHERDHTTQIGRIPLIGG